MRRIMIAATLIAATGVIAGVAPGGVVSAESDGCTVANIPEYDGVSSSFQTANGEFHKGEIVRVTADEPASDGAAGIRMQAGLSGETPVVVDTANGLPAQVEYQIPASGVYNIVWDTNFANEDPNPNETVTWTVECIPATYSATVVGICPDGPAVEVTNTGTGDIAFLIGTSTNLVTAGSGTQTFSWPTTTGAVPIPEASWSVVNADTSETVDSGTLSLAQTCETTTTTAAPTTTVAETTTTVAATTTTVAATTTVAEVTTTAAPTTSIDSGGPSGTLPATGGSSNGSLAVTALAVTLLGVALAALSRRSRPTGA